MVLWGSVLGGFGGIGVAGQFLSYAVSAAIVICANRLSVDESAKAAVRPETAPQRGLVPAPADLLARAPAPPQEKPRASAELFRKRCQECHGAAGNGVPMRNSLPLLPDFTDATWHGKRRDEQLLISILDGKGRDMPAFRDKFSAKQARDLVAIVRAFNSERAVPSSSADSSSIDFERRLQELQSEMADLKKQFHQLNGQGTRKN
jgi:mono/diheme cytochrome c family protein